MYLMIQNPGVAPVEGYTLLGVSTTRNCGVAGTIGQFGSGAKHAINTLLRAGLKLLIYCGKTRLEFTTREDSVNDGLVTKPIKRVVCKLGGTSSKTLDMGWCLDFGAIDWTDLSMALREFVANAIDRTVREKGDFLATLLNEELRVAVVEDSSVRARDGFTRVYVEVNPDVQRFYGELPRRFLHFSSQPQLVKEFLLPKADRNLSGKRTAMIYKEGVLVREIAEDEEASVYDYNFHNGDLRLDESRNSSEYEIKGAAARLFRKASAQQLAPVFKSLVAQEPTYEATFDSYYMAPSYSDPEPEQKQAWQQGWELAAGPDAVLCDASLNHTAEFVEKKGFRPKPTKAASWISAAARCGVKTAATILDGHESNGKQILPATNAAIEAVDIVWSWLQEINMTQGKAKPRVACFKECMKAGSETMGFCRDGMVYFKEDNARLIAARRGEPERPGVGPPRRRLEEETLAARRDAMHLIEPTIQVALVVAVGGVDSRCPQIGTKTMKAKLQGFLAYTTGALALVVVAAAAGSAITYAVMHGAETLTHLGNSALQGIGMAIGGCLGSALVLRFKVARRYVKNVLNEIHEKRN